MYSQVDSALLLSETWKLRLSIVKKDFVRLNNYLKINVEKLVEENENDEKLETVEKILNDIFEIGEFIEEINDIIKKVGRYPLSVENIERITFFEKEYYMKTMTPDIFETLSEEVKQEERLNSMLNEMVNSINEMWDNGETEDNMKNYLENMVRKIYTTYNDEQINILTNTMYNSLTAQKPVRVNLSEEQIQKLEKRQGFVGTCGTCLENYSEKDEVIHLKCEHNFHSECIIPWLKRSVKCPNCRCDLRE